MTAKIGSEQFVINKRQRQPKVIQEGLNPEKLATFYTQDTRRRQIKQNKNTICVGHRITQLSTTNVVIKLNQ